MKFSSIATVIAAGTAILLSVAACGEDARAHQQHHEEMASPMHMDHQDHQGEHVSTARTAFDKTPDVGTRARCPVTKNEFEVREESAHSEYKGNHYVFCCPGCKPKFDENPEKYIMK